MSIKSALTLFLYRVARNIAPVVRYKSSTFVFRYADVVEVLERDEDFTIGPINAVNVERHVGPFLLGLDAGPQLKHEQGVMYGIILREDAHRIQIAARKLAEKLLDEATARKSLDLVADFTRIVPLRTVGDYFGVNGAPEADLLRWNRLIFWDIFLNLDDDPDLRSRATVASDEWNKYLLDIIEARAEVAQRGGRLPNDVISRLVSLQGSGKPALDNDGIRRNVSGSYLGGEEPISRVCAHALFELFKRPKALAAARKSSEENDLKAVRGLALDALRYKPSNPLLIRYSEEEKYVSASGKRRKIKAQSKVYAMTQSAMFDPTVFPKPRKILPDRPLDSYLHFGWGLHICYGNYINYVIIPEIIMAILRRPEWAPDGDMVYEGTFPDRWPWKLTEG
ncbi:MAG: cytochrome P450 [Bacteroidota bacterium]